MYAINGKGNVLGISFTIKQEIDEAYHPHTCVSCWLKERKHLSVHGNDAKESICRSVRFICLPQF